jgi:serine protease inhibitor
VDEQTSHHISELFPADVLRPEDRDRLRMVLTNAIYFKGEWSQVFPAEQSREEEFLLSGGAAVRVPMMHHSHLDSAGYAAFNGNGSMFTTPTEVPADGAGRQQPVYPDERGFAVLEMPYKGGNLSMAIVAPRAADGLAAVEKLLTPANLAGWLEELQTRTVNTFVPRFKLESSYEMSSALKSLGMVRAFVDPLLPGGAQFDGICDSQEPRQRLHIGKVLHEARVEVTEKGTEAAAATAVIALPPPKAVARMVPFTPTFRADRPFIFVIRDRISGSILFVGRVVDPS